MSRKGGRHKNSIAIGSQIKRWTTMKAELNLATNEAMAKFLMNQYTEFKGLLHGKEQTAMTGTEPYIITLCVTLEQEAIIQKLCQMKGWPYTCLHGEKKTRTTDSEASDLSLNMDCEDEGEAVTKSQATQVYISNFKRSQSPSLLPRKQQKLEIPTSKPNLCLDHLSRVTHPSTVCKTRSVPSLPENVPGGTDILETDTCTSVNLPVLPLNANVNEYSDAILIPVTSLAKVNQVSVPMVNPLVTGQPRYLQPVDNSSTSLPNKRCLENKLFHDSSKTECQVETVSTCKPTLNSDSKSLLPVNLKSLSFCSPRDDENQKKSERNAESYCSGNPASLTKPQLIVCDNSEDNHLILNESEASKLCIRSSTLLVKPEISSPDIENTATTVNSSPLIPVIPITKQSASTSQIPSVKREPPDQLNVEPR